MAESIEVYNSTIVYALMNVAVRLSALLLPNDLSAYDGTITLTVMLIDENNFHSKLVPNAALLPD